ncbi:phage tail repeat-like family [Trichomonas vaginalis G3]|uniref:phage tail repeat-like family n=1 Tax=Trichomonas vaginalis (strain ATCC PRA-98 / G3) TaxID=412133 RepID=UPI0021E6049C|nr:phage tail repeat-like family [Trichomonas vaginalis G3]KAI5492137.1 phage tail repeat-like family [Trichomonas vaginalis G3]
MSKETASMREIQHNRQLIIQALNKNTTNFSNYSKISESLKEGNLKLTLNPLTDEFLFQDKKNNTVCVNPTKGTLNEKPIKELLLKADVDNKADKEYVIEKVQEEHDRADATYATKADVDNKADKEYVDNKMSSEVTRAENEYSKKTHTHTIANITNLQETLNRKSDVGHTHSISEITDLNVSLEKKADKETVDMLAQTVSSHTRGLMEDGQQLKELEKGVTELRNTKADSTWIKGYVDATKERIFAWTEGTYPQKYHRHSISDVNELEEKLYKKADKTELQTLKTEILQTVYPIGSIYTSMNSTRPEVVLGFGTWTQIVDRFLYCANSSKETGGSKTISGANLPAHSHYINLSTSEAGLHRHKYWGWSTMTKGKGYDVKEDVQFAINGSWDDTWREGDHTHRVSGYTQTTDKVKTTCHLT